LSTAGTITFLIGLAAVLFGAWGIHTKMGRSRFDEMAGIIPYSAWYLGIGLIALAVVLWIVIAVRK
tara:strand:+ start:436 stop:633 length:198 start_codon:yes stop_codon:yes gene_type:complete